MESVLHGGRNRVFVEFDEQIVMLVYAESARIFAQRLQILGIEVKITPGSECQTVADFGLQLVSQLADPRIVEMIVVVRMRRRYNMSDPVRDGRLGHCQGFFEGGRPVIESRQDVAVQINHGVPKLLSGPRRTAPATRPMQTSLPQISDAFSAAEFSWQVQRQEFHPQKSPVSTKIPSSKIHSPPSRRR